MASRGVSVLKFVGTVSLGLLTGLSYTLSTLTVPTLLTLPSANTAAKAFRNLATTAKKHLRALTTVSWSTFLLAYILSPRPYRHPYLLYTSVLVLGSRLATSELLAPYLFLSPRDGSISTAASALLTKHDTRTAKKERSAPRPVRMDMSYEVLGSDSHSEGAGSEELEAEATEEGAATTQEEQINGEQVRHEVEGFLKKQIVQTAVAGLGFLMAVIGIWGDGTVEVFQSETFIIEA